MSRLAELNQCDRSRRCGASPSRDSWPATGASTAGSACASHRWGGSARRGRRAGRRSALARPRALQAAHPRGRGVLRAARSGPAGGPRVARAWLHGDGGLLRGAAGRPDQRRDRPAARRRRSPLPRSQPRVMNSWRKSAAVAEAISDQRLADTLRFLLDRPADLFQTISFVGSQQSAHSGAFRMMTEPPGHLVGVWAALEDIEPDQGPGLLPARQPQAALPDERWARAARAEEADRRRQGARLRQPHGRDGRVARRRSKGRMRPARAWWRTSSRGTSSATTR